MHMPLRVLACTGVCCKPACLVSYTMKHAGNLMHCMPGCSHGTAIAVLCGLVAHMHHALLCWVLLKSATCLPINTLLTYIIAAA